ncbi:MAG: N-acetylneuraminate synthase family protein [Ruminococcus flavefaciens]|nr:N-acetylneuraminate synthase family protein [Ruminococcus flavefaciens]
MREIHVGNLKIGEGAKPLVVPEIGINHNGSLDVAKLMVDAAYRAGARIIKHQTHIVEDEMCHVARNVIPGNADISIYEIMEQAALNREDEEELKRYTEQLGMIFMSTPFSRAAAERLEDFDVQIYKIGSGEMNNYPLLDYVASFGKPMIVSTGMNDLASVDKAVNILERRGVNYALMHTTNLYPTSPELVRLGAMQQLMEAYPNVPVGLSDHTTNNNACIAAIALGAKLVERHFTDTMERKGPDIICSMDYENLKKLLQAANEVSEMLGGNKEKALEETVTSDFAFASIVTIKAIHKGEAFNRNNLWVKRPGTGELPADQYDAVLGKTAAVDIEEDTLLRKEMIR